MCTLVGSSVMLHNIQPVCQSVAMVIHLRFRDRRSYVVTASTYLKRWVRQIHSLQGIQVIVRLRVVIIIFEVVWLGGNGFAIQWMDWGDESPKFGSLQAR